MTKTEGIGQLQKPSFQLWGKDNPNPYVKERQGEGRRNETDDFQEYLRLKNIESSIL